MDGWARYWKTGARRSPATISITQTGATRPRRSPRFWRNYGPTLIHKLGVTTVAAWLSDTPAHKTFKRPNAIGDGARRHHEVRPRFRGSIPRGLKSRSADLPCVSRGPLLPEECESRQI